MAHTRSVPSITAINSSRPTAVYVSKLGDHCFRSLVQIRACQRTVDKPLSAPVTVWYQLNPWQKSLLKFQSKYSNLKDNAFQNIVCKVATISSAALLLTRIKFNFKMDKLFHATQCVGWYCIFIHELQRCSRPGFEVDINFIMHFIGYMIICPYLD